MWNANPTKQQMIPKHQIKRPKTDMIKKRPLVLPIPFSHANIGVSWEMTPEWKRGEGGWERGSERPRVLGWIMVWRVEGQKGPLSVLVFKANILDTVLFHPTQEGSLLYGEFYMRTKPHLKGSRPLSISRSDILGGERESELRLRTPWEVQGQW